MRHDRLRALLGELTAEDRRLLEYRIVDGWDYDDVAIHLRTTRDVLVNRVRRLRTELKRKAKALGAVERRAGVEAAQVVKVESPSDQRACGSKLSAADSKRKRCPVLVLA